METARAEAKKKKTKTYFKSSYEKKMRWKYVSRARKRQRAVVRK